jgi:spermidine dehydrogenase
MPELGSAAKKDRLARMSYASFITKTRGLDPGVVTLFQARTHPLYGVGIEAVSAQDAWGLGLPGFAAMSLDPAPGPGMGLDAIRNKEADRYFFHFPDGNATMARLLVRALIPSALPGRTADDSVTARADYGRLDVPRAAARVRLDSTVVRVRHEGEVDSAKTVEVAYVRGGRLEKVTARRCVLACWHAIVPLLCPELPDNQKAALAEAIKVPLVYTSVLLRGWRPFVKLPRASSIAPAAWSSTPPSSRTSSARRATSSRACWARVASTPRATSPPSPSTGGRTATPTSTTRSSIRSG